MNRNFSLYLIPRCHFETFDSIELIRSLNKLWLSRNYYFLLIPQSHTSLFTLIMTTEKHNKMKTIMKLKREVFLEYWKPLLKTLKSETDEKFDKIYNLNKRKASVNEKLQSK